MKPILTLFAILCLTGCTSLLGGLTKDLVRDQAGPLVERKITEALRNHSPELLAKIDQNKNGLAELKEVNGDLMKDPTLWGLIVTAVGGLLFNRRIRGEVDELYDKTVAQK